jgi:hypothetical protein
MKISAVAAIVVVIAICALNILLGWTFLGWIVALVWALIRTGSRARA